MITNFNIDFILFTYILVRVYRKDTFAIFVVVVVFSV